ncbi:MAG TPA: flagellar motor protein [Bryobacteraceae bacterium]|nr:flagellar motor protein [Bryobacteraceae bacterium]
MAAAKKASVRPDIATFAGLALAFGGIIAGLLLEGGKLGQILQPTAAMIVFGGTFGAVMVTMPLSALMRSVRAVTSVFLERQQQPEAIVEEIIGYATKARKSGIVGLEQDAESVQDPFLRKALNLAVDGTDLQEIRKMMELDMGVEEHRDESAAKVFEAAGGYAPTIGIIGAVLGLIQVMQHIQNVEEVGKGIAVAFVATIYGVGIANLFLIPAAGKIRARAHAANEMRELMLEGISGIVEGLNPKLIRVKLEAFVESKSKPGAKAPAKAATAKAA